MHCGSVNERAWYIGCALGLQPREEISIISVRSKVSAGVAYWLGVGPPVRATEFDSPHSLHAGVAEAALDARFRCAREESQVSRHLKRLADAELVYAVLGESFNGRTAGLQPANEGSIPSSSTNFAREAVAVKAPA